jgi:hypothetical protein
MNRNEGSKFKTIKDRILADYRSLAEFARVAETKYVYLAHTLSGLHSYRESIEVLKKFGYIRTESGPKRRQVA